MTRSRRTMRTNRESKTRPTGMARQTGRLGDRRRGTNRTPWRHGTVQRALSTTIVDFRIQLVAVLALSGLFIVSEARAQEAKPVRIEKRAPRPEPATGLPKGLGTLPSRVPLALYAPNLVGVLADLDELIGLAALVEPALEGRSTPELGLEFVFGRGLPLGWGLPKPKRPDLARLTTQEGLREIGVDPTGPVSAVFDPALRVAIVRFELAHRPTWEKWLDRQAGADRRRVDFGGERASILAEDSDWPITCLARKTQVTCQIGAAEGETPLGPLKMVSSSRGTTLEKIPALARAYTALPREARIYGLINTPSMATWLGEVARRSESRAYRFETTDKRARATRHARLLGEKVRHYAAKVEGTAFGLYRTPEGVRLQMQAALSPTGAKILKSHLRPSGEHSVVTGWANTPALSQVILRVHPQSVERIGRRFGLPLPNASLTGDLAFMTLGVDSECPMAKQARQARPLSWMFMMPTATAIGVAGPEAADALHTAVRSTLAPETAGPSRTGGPRPRLHGEVAHSPYDVEVRDDVMLVGTGYGSGFAAARRLRSTRAPSPRRAPPLLEANVDLDAVNAAFASGSFGTEHRPELLAVEALRLRFNPLLEHVGQLRLTVRAQDGARMVEAQLDTRPGR